MLVKYDVLGKALLRSWRSLQLHPAYEAPHHCNLALWLCQASFPGHALDGGTLGLGRHEQHATNPGNCFRAAASGNAALYCLRGHGAVPLRWPQSYLDATHTRTLTHFCRTRLAAPTYSGKAQIKQFPSA